MAAPECDERLGKVVPVYGLLTSGADLAGEHSETTAFLTFDRHRETLQRIEKKNKEKDINNRGTINHEPKRKTRKRMFNKSMKLAVVPTKNDKASLRLPTARENKLLQNFESCETFS